MADIALCENKMCERSLDCLRFTAAANPYRQTYLVETKENCEKDKFKHWVPNFRGISKK